MKWHDGYQKENAFCLVFIKSDKTSMHGRSYSVYAYAVRRAAMLAAFALRCRFCSPHACIGGGELWTTWRKRRMS